MNERCMPELEIFCLRCRSEPRIAIPPNYRECKCPHGMVPDFVAKYGAKLFRNLEIDENDYFVSGEEV